MTLRCPALRFFAAFLLLLTPVCASAASVLASWYGQAHKGRKTASGVPFDPMALTAASWRYPFGTLLRVTNVCNHKAVTVRVNDRGPDKHTGRVLDVSERAAELLGFKRAGIAHVTIEVVTR